MNTHDIFLYFVNMQMNIVIPFHRVNEKILIISNVKKEKSRKTPVTGQDNYETKLILQSF